MANTKRRAEYTDRMGKMFIPMNIEGGTWNEHFITTPKLVCIVGIVLSLVIFIIYLNSSQVSLLGYLIVLGAWFFISLLITRFIIFEEKFYYRMYLELKDNEISTPALFWDIASIKDDGNGAILTYSDAKIGVMVKIDRDTITGKDVDFKETHYDAISDFYKEVVTNNYSFVQMNIMEHAGKDPRLNQLSKLIYKNDNENICKLVEMQVGHIKNLVHKSLYESDYFLFYTSDITKVDTILQDVTDFIFKLLDGAFIGYEILSSRQIVDFIKEEYGVNYFNSTEASLLMFNKDVSTALTPFNITGILWADGEKQELNNREINRLRSMTSGVINGSSKNQNISLKNTIYRKDNKNRIGIDFDSLDDVPIKKSNNTQNNNKDYWVIPPKIDESQEIKIDNNDSQQNDINIKDSLNDDILYSESDDEDGYIDF